MKLVKTIHEVLEGVIPSAKIFNSVKIIGLCRIIGVALLFIFIINSAVSSASTLISLKKLRLDEEIPFLLQFLPVEWTSAEAHKFKLVTLDKLLLYYFKIDQLKVNGMKEKSIDWTGWEWARAFKFEQNKGGSLFFLAKGEEKIIEAREGSNEGKQETGRNKARSEEITKPEFKNIKEKISFYAFLAWLWLVIGVLLYILNEQIKEAERRRQLGL